MDMIKSTDPAESRHSHTLARGSHQELNFYKTVKPSLHKRAASNTIIPRAIRSPSAARSCPDFKSTSTSTNSSTVRRDQSTDMLPHEEEYRVHLMREWTAEAEARANEQEEKDNLWLRQRGIQPVPMIVRSPEEIKDIIREQIVQAFGQPRCKWQSSLKSATSKLVFSAAR